MLSGLLLLLLLYWVLCCCVLCCCLPTMSRRSGFTDAELAAAAWRRNMKIKGSMKEEEEAEVGDLEASSATGR